MGPLRGWRSGRYTNSKAKVPFLGFGAANQHRAVLLLWLNVDNMTYKKNLITVSQISLSSINHSHSPCFSSSLSWLLTAPLRLEFEKGRIFVSKLIVSFGFTLQTL
ncbi:PREDICTED: uncharacterized protein LOC104742667 [Camelina sativa]|uniref:Uncharacterized protein LOC104742667 n=1 Tax=Camelina sativa TaxID=90675 RepID=A0ABM0VW88_CAMSA|nr:PREDICTED: uncharacterized protein LOC104742667 [Camelina sativa]